jgi:hypothetical protein
VADRDPRRDPREGDEFEAPPRPYYLQEQRTIIERYEKDGKAMVRYETTDEWGETIHHIVQFASFRRWAKRATVLYAAEVLSK